MLLGEARACKLLVNLWEVAPWRAASMLGLFCDVARSAALAVGCYGQGGGAVPQPQAKACDRHTHRPDPSQHMPY